MNFFSVSKFVRNGHKYFGVRTKEQQVDEQKRLLIKSELRTTKTPFCLSVCQRRSHIMCELERKINRNVRGFGRVLVVL